MSNNNRNSTFSSFGTSSSGMSMSTQTPVSRTADDWKQLGNEAFAKQEYDTAIAHYTHAIQMDPTNHVFFSNRSACYAGKKEWAAAAIDAKECIKLDPTFIKGYYRLATAQIESTDYDAATATIKQGLNMDKKNLQLIRQLQSIQHKQQALNKKLKQATSLAAPAALPLMGGSNGADSAISKELQELHQQYIIALRELKTTEANIAMAQREYKSNELTKSELEELLQSSSNTTMTTRTTFTNTDDDFKINSKNTDIRMYRSIGKMFMLASNPQQVMDHLTQTMLEEKQREEELIQRQAYWNKRLVSHQQNIQELLPTNNKNTNATTKSSGAGICE